MSAVADLEIGDSRVEFMADYVLKTLKCKPDRWMKMYNVDETKQMFMDWFEKPDLPAMVIISNPGGSLTAQYEWPANPKQKACYFVKRSRDGISKDVPFRQAVLYGDLSYSPLDQLSAFVDEVLVPLLSNDRNHDHWPHVVSKDVTRHVHNLKSNVYVVSGQAKGKTLLPLPVGAERVSELIDIDSGDGFDRALCHAIESMVIEWTHQIQDVLKRDSAQPLLEGLNPTPFVELEFWKNKASNLDCIYEQLRDTKVRKMAELLEKTNSSYFVSFKEIFRDVVAGLTEAQDINMYLKPMRHHFEDYEQAEFDESKKLLAPMMNALCLVWANSEYYNTPARIIVLLQEICNMIINMATTFLEPAEIFKGEIEETIDKVRKACDVLKAFKETYEDHRIKLKSYFPEGTEPREWEFAPKLVFARYDKFCDRVETVRELMETVLEFMKLEKIELGGIKGKVLSQQVVDIFEAFQAEYKVFTEASYDCLNPNDPSFINHYCDFKEAVADFDRRMATIICQGFDDCSGLESAFKLLDIMGSLLERELIKKDFEEKYPILVQMMNRELDIAKEIYDNQMAIKHDKGKIPIHTNMPAVTGGLKWAEELKQRLSEPMSSYKHLDHPVMESEDAKLVFTKYEEMLQLLSGWDEDIYKEWIAGVDEACSFNLNQPLINRNEETKLIQVNFDPQLVAVLREVKYLEIRDSEQEKIPDSATAIYQRYDTLWKFVTNLDTTVKLYNKVRNTVLEVEFPLIEGQVADIDNLLQQAESTLNWNSDGIWDYIQKTRDQVIDLESRVQKAKNNVDEIVKLMSTWSKAPLFTRKEEKNDTLLNLTDREERLNKRYTEIKNIGNQIHGLLKDNLELFKADSNSDIWKAYVDYVDEMIVDGFFSTIHCSLKFLLDNTDPKNNPDDLFKALLELQAQEMIFIPSLDFGVPDGFYDLVDGLVGDIYKQSSLIKRLAAHSGQEHYQPDLEDMEELSDMRQELMDRMQNIMNKSMEYRNSFDNYAYLWVDDRNEFMRQFLLYNHVLTTEEIEAHAEDGVPECPPTLPQFKEQIDTYERIYEEAEHIEPIKVFDRWFRIDAKPFKQALLNIIKRWSFMFKQHLIDHVTNRWLIDLGLEKEEELLIGLVSQRGDGQTEEMVKTQSHYSLHPPAA